MIEFLQYIVGVDSPEGMNHARNLIGALWVENQEQQLEDTET